MSTYAARLQVLGNGLQHPPCYLRFRNKKGDAIKRGTENHFLNFRIKGGKFK